MPTPPQGDSYHLLLDYRDEDDRLTPFIDYFEGVMHHCSKVLPAWRRG